MRGEVSYQRIYRYRQSESPERRSKLLYRQPESAERGFKLSENTCKI